MRAFRLVYDPESENFCDNCGCAIPPGTPYYAQEDDRLILCKKCTHNGEYPKAESRS